MSAPAEREMGAAGARRAANQGDKNRWVGRNGQRQLRLAGLGTRAGELCRPSLAALHLEFLWSWPKGGRRLARLCCWTAATPVRPEVSKGSLVGAMFGARSESPQAPSALHPEFLLSCQKEPKALRQTPRPFGVPCSARNPGADSNSLHSLRSLRSDSESGLEVEACFASPRAAVRFGGVQMAEAAEYEQPAANSRTIPSFHQRAVSRPLAVAPS
jgi:hypothetical protein